MSPPEMSEHGSGHLGHHIILNATHNSVHNFANFERTTFNEFSGCLYLQS